MHSMSHPSKNIGLTTRIRLYRKVRCLGKQLNAFSSGRIVPATMTVAPWAQIFCSFVIIKLSSTLPSEGLITYPIVIAMAFMDLMLFETFAAQLGIKSNQVMEMWKREGRITRFHRREFWAMQAITIKIEGNFIDRGTALVTQNFCVTTTASLLLMKWIRVL